MSFDNILCVDVETNTTNPVADNLLITQTTALDFFDPEKYLYRHINPGDEALRTISPSAIGVNKLTPDILRKRGEDPVEVMTDLVETIHSYDLLIGHNFRYDISAIMTYCDVLGISNHIQNIPYIDTLRVGQEIYDVVEWAGNWDDPIIPDLKLATLYYRVVDESKWSQLLGLAHDSLFDSQMVREIVIEWLEGGLSLEYMIELTNTPFEPRVCPIGDYRHKPWAEVPIDFLQWMVRKNVYEGDEGLEIAVLTEIDRRS